MLLFLFIPLFCIAHLSSIRPFDKFSAGSSSVAKSLLCGPTWVAFPRRCRTGGRPLSLAVPI